MKFGFREKIIAASAVLVLIVIGWYMLYFSPKKIEIDSMRADIQQIQSDLSSINVTDAMLDSLRKEIATIQESELQITQDIQTNNDKLFPDVNAPIDTSTLESKTGIRPIDMDLFLQGSFEELVIFLESFENFPFLIRAGNIMVSTDDFLYPDLKIDLTVYFFLEIR
jgi:hypothetical protein